MSQYQTIPLNLFQFVADTDIQSQNSEFSYYTFEIDSALSFIIEKFPKFSESLDNADENYVMGLWKLCCLYVHGGIFLDNDYRCADDFTLIELTDKEYFLVTGPMRLSGSIISVFPNNKFIKRAIDTYSGHSFIKTKAFIKHSSKLKINKDVIMLQQKVIFYILFCVSNVNSLNKQKNNDNYFYLIDEFCQLYETNKYEIIKNPKMDFRYLCFRYLVNIRNFNIPNIVLGNTLETVFIEFRRYPHIEFIIRNAIIKLGENWSHTIICGISNYEFICNICNEISPNIKIIKTNFDNVTRNDYNSYITSLDFWNQLDGEKILIHQEDSLIFKNNIDDFLQFDYIGAPWIHHPKNYQVGNGGFSLRSKSIMIKIIQSICLEKDTMNNYVKSKKFFKYNMRNCSDLTMLPEDVYFSKNMVELKIGLVADLESASKFSTETILNTNSFGGHQFWLSDSCWKKRVDDCIFIDDIKSQKIIGIYHPYHFTLGGGEKYLSTMIKCFIKKGYVVMFYNYSNTSLVFKTFSNYLNPLEIKYIKHFSDRYILNSNYKNNLPKFDYFIYLNNNSIPRFAGLGKINIYHCQFPYDLNVCANINDTNTKIKLSSYDIIYVNSEFTENYIKKSFDNKNTFHRNIKILYPSCFYLLNNDYYEKEENTFIMIGRIFPSADGGNNKKFDTAINVFNSLKNLNYKLYIIGSVKDYNYYNYLYNLIEDRNKIFIFTDITDEEKDKLIKKSKYYIQLTGMGDKYAYNQEHFGISTMECINYNCFPICFNGGYSSYIIKNYDNGILIENEDELKTTIMDIVNKKIDCHLNKSSFNLEKYTFEYFEKTLNELISI